MTTASSDRALARAALRLGTVVATWRYPVSSLGGESLDALTVTPHGVAGDRAYAVCDVATGRYLSAVTDPRLLSATAAFGDLGVEVTLPDGSVFLAGEPATDVALTDWLGRAVRLRRRPRPPVEKARLHVVTTATLRAAAALHPAGAWDARRFRPNVVVDVPGARWAEDEWIGEPVRAGSAVLTPYKATVRCPVTTHPQPGLPADPHVLLALAAHHAKTLGVYARVAEVGQVAMGARVELPGLG